jgi:hypothetical protein
MTTNFLNKLKNKTSSIKSATVDLINVVKVDEDTKTDRMNICLSCEHLFHPTKNCKKCGCFMEAKTWLKSASCPIKKW